MAWISASANSSVDPAGNIVFSGAAEELKSILVRTLGDEFFKSRRRHDSADSAIFTIARDAMGDSHGVTLSLSGDFLDPARVGQLIEATGEVVRAGGKTIFVAGIVKADGNAVLRFDGIIRKVRGSR